MKEEEPRSSEPPPMVDFGGGASAAGGWDPRDRSGETSSEVATARRKTAAVRSYGPAKLTVDE